MISFQNVTFSYDGRSPVLSDVSFHIDEGRKVGLIGGNGAGKSTILSLIKGDLECDSGSVQVTGVVQSMSQIPPASLSTCATPARAWLDEQASLGLLDFDHVHRILRAMQIPASTPLCELSEGQRWKLHLCLSVLQPGVDILLLDEPSSHLDLPAALLLQQLIAAAPATVVLVSHDAALLDATATLILALSPSPDGCGSTAASSSASYSDFLRERERAARRAEWTALHASRKAAQLQKVSRALFLAGAHGEKYLGTDNDKLQRDFFRDRSARSLHAAGVRARQRDREARCAREAADEAKGAEAAAKAQRVWFGGGGGAGRRRELDEAHCVELMDVRLRYGGEGESGPVGGSAVSFCVSGGEHVAMVGRNGAGKSLLLKALADSAEVSLGGGMRRAGKEAKVFFWGQEGLQGEKTAVQWVQEVGVGAKREEVVKWVVSVGVPFEAVDVPLSELSPGQRARVAVLVMRVTKANVLLLDEVTNFMDPGARTAIFEFLEGFDGAVVCVTHDRELLGEMEWDRVVEVANGGDGGGMTLTEVQVDDWLEKGQCEADDVINLILS